MENQYLYKELENKTKKFYSDLICLSINSDKLKDAVASLTMPQYASIYNDRNPNNSINDHRALATLGDAVCGALLLTKKYHYDSTKEELTFEKELLTNDNLNVVGKNMLKDNLFYANNDLDEKNTKSYATSFEAVIGFLSLIDINKAKEVFDRYIE